MLGKTERTISAIGGSLLLYFVSRKHKKESLLLAAGGYLLYRAISGKCPVSATLREGGRDHRPSNVNVRTQVTVNSPREEVYAFWRRLENLPLFMKHLESVDELSDTISAWKVKIPGGLGDVRWEAEIIKDVENAEISWQSTQGASVENTGKINFSDTPAGGTRIDVMISYRAPMGVLGERLSRLLTPVFKNMIEKDIEGFKHFMEDTEKVNQSF
ncbi:SRPBCC family protein [Flavitalea sp. BT771]|uniref:SRPBCC family protein n=1 Tax=Flavitalea sp. BT771 TaxID=3063329 RepID=UPI0026E26781|nr:SRPBCC family protein [Flavitalea sp. BT771]MDO6430584.1 SRPBCC family protein [Flavitalea sp. BT771]MDV6219276.1 SRPBCC family protein [Flavitalea sp. BT771]